jgi:hypothetical protein
MIDYEVAVSVPVTKQVGIDSWRDKLITRVFSSKTSVQTILDWAKGVDKTLTLGDLYFSEIFDD